MCVGVVAAATLTSAPAEAGDVAQASVVSENPADMTPNVLPDSVVTQPAVLALGHRAQTIYAGGNFHSVEKADGSKAVTRHNIVAFDSGTGAIRRFAPRVNGTVWAVQPYRKAVFLGGEFSTVDGVARRAIVKVNATTGAVVNAFAPSFPSGSVTEIRMVRGRLIVGGSIPGKLVSLNPRTGQTTNYLKELYVRYGRAVGGSKWAPEFEALRKQLAPDLNPDEFTVQATTQPSSQAAPAAAAAATTTGG